MTPVDALLVTGFPGAGKSTLIAGWLAERPAHERWAVLVNGSGSPGDAAPLTTPHDGRAPVGHAEVAGGCACCAARVAFEVTLGRLLRRGPWDRLLIETTGLGHPAQLVDRLRSGLLAPLVRLRAPIAVIDAGRAARLLDPERSDSQAAIDQIVLARAIVLNRTDPVGPQGAASLAGRLAASPPWPRQVLETATGRVPFATVQAALDADVHRPGWSWPATVEFDRGRLVGTLDDPAGPAGPWRACGLLHGQGVFRTARAWYAWRWADGRGEWTETAWRADSRLEVVANGPCDPQMVDQALRAAAVTG